MGGFSGNRNFWSRADNSGMLSKVILVALLIGLSSVLFCTTDANAEGKICTVYLNDGSVLKGELISMNAQSLVLQTKAGRLTLKASEISRISYEETPAVPTPVPAPAPVPAPVVAPEATNQQPAPIAPKQKEKKERKSVAGAAANKQEDVNHKGFLASFNVGTGILELFGDATIENDLGSSEASVYLGPSVDFGFTVGYRTTNWIFGLNWHYLIGNGYMEFDSGSEDFDYHWMRYGPVVGYVFDSKKSKWAPFLGGGFDYGECSFWVSDWNWSGGFTDIYLTGGFQYFMFRHFYVGVSGRWDLVFGNAYGDEWEGNDTSMGVTWDTISAYSHVGVMF